MFDDLSESPSEDSTEDFGSFPASPANEETMTNNGEAMDLGLQENHPPQQQQIPMQQVDMSQFDQAELNRMMAQAQIILQAFRAEFDGQLTPLQTRVSQLENAQQQHAQAIQVNTARIEEISKAQDTADLRSIEHANKIVALETRATNNESLVDEVDVEVRRQATEIQELQTQQAETKTNQEALSDALKEATAQLADQGKQIAEILQLRESNSEHAVPLPPPKPNKVFGEYMNLVKTAAKMGVNFTLGKKPPKPKNTQPQAGTENSCRASTQSLSSLSQTKSTSEDSEAESSIPVKVVGETLTEIGDYFTSLDLPARWEIFPVSQNPKIFRLVPGEGFEELLPQIRVELDSIGWWISRSSPNQFRQMEGRTRKFLAKLKEEKSSLSSTWFTLQHGFVVHLGTNIFPYFLVPEKEELWPALFDHVEGHLSAFLNKSWVDQFKAKSGKDTRDFVKKFAELAQLKELL